MKWTQWIMTIFHLKKLKNCLYFCCVKRFLRLLWKEDSWINEVKRSGGSKVVYYTFLSETGCVSAVCLIDGYVEISILRSLFLKYPVRYLYYIHILCKYLLYLIMKVVLWMNIIIVYFYNNNNNNNHIHTSRKRIDNSKLSHLTLKFRLFCSFRSA